MEEIKGVLYPVLDKKSLKKEEEEKDITHKYSNKAICKMLYLIVIIVKH